MEKTKKGLQSAAHNINTNTQNHIRAKVQDNDLVVTDTDKNVSATFTTPEQTVLLNTVMYSAMSVLRDETIDRLEGALD